MIWTRGLAAVLLGCGLLTAAPSGVLAQDVNITLGGTVAPKGQQAADDRIVNDAIAAMRANGFSALEPHLPRLKEALVRAPASFPIVERNGDDIVIRATDDGQYFLLSLVAAAPVSDGDGKAKKGRKVQVSRGANTYPMAALILGSYYVETKRPDEALTYLDRGLAIQPNNSSLIIEKGAALLSLRRFADAVALYDAALANNDLALLDARARLMRNRGVALIDLDRLEEAEAALNESIKTDPNDKIGVASARRELAYIDGLRKGAKPTGIELQTRMQAEDATAKPK